MPWNFPHPLSRRTYVRADDFVGTKISWMHRKPNFLTNGSLLRALYVRKSRSAIRRVTWVRLVVKCFKEATVNEVELSYYKTPRVRTCGAGVAGERFHSVFILR